MNDVLSNILQHTTPRFNKSVTEGTSKEIMKHIPDYLDDIFKSSIRSLSASVPLRYEGYRKMIPEEEFDTIILNKNGKTIYDLTNSDIYPVEYIFNYNGEPIKKQIYLPFSARGNLMAISSVKYNIIPVLSDTVISPSPQKIFIRLLKDKLTFKSVVRNYVVNGERVPGHVIYTKIVKIDSIKLTDRIGKPVTSIALYLVAKYGWKQTLKLFGNIEDYVVTTGDVEHYRHDYNVFESSKIKPRGLKESVYVGHDIKICINKKYPMTSFLKNFLFGIIYSLDLLPEQADDMLSVVNGNNLADEIMYWRILLGRIIYKNSFSIDRIVEDMTEHFDTLEGYIDNLIKAKLRDSGIHIENFYDLLQIILENFNTWILNSKEYNSDINNRYIDILYYIMFDIILSFNKSILNINKRASKKNDLLSYKEVVKLLGEVKTKTIFQLVKSSSPNLAIQLTEATSDIMYPKITALLEDQSRGNGVKRGNNTQFPEATKTLRGHDLYLGSLLFLTKTSPSPRFRSNLYMHYDIYTGKLSIPNDLKNIVENLDKQLTADKLENSKVQLLESDSDGLSL